MDCVVLWLKLTNFSSLHFCCLSLPSLLYLLLHSLYGFCTTIGIYSSDIICFDDAIRCHGISFSIIPHNCLFVSISEFSFCLLLLLFEISFFLFVTIGDGYYFHIILVADWCWVTVISINVLLCCYRAVASFFLSGFSISSFFLSWISFYWDFLSVLSFFLLGFSFFLIGRIFLSGFSLSFTGRIFLSGFYSPSIGRVFLSGLLSRTVLQAVSLHCRVGFFFRCFLPSFDVIYLSITEFRALSLHRNTDWSSHPAPAILFR